MVGKWIEDAIPLITKLEAFSFFLFPSPLALPVFQKQGLVPKVG